MSTTTLDTYPVRVRFAQGSYGDLANQVRIPNHAVKTLTADLDRVVITDTPRRLVADYYTRGDNPTRVLRTIDIFSV